MDMFSRAGMMTMSLRCLCHLVLRALRRIRAFSTTSPETYKIANERVHPPSTQAAIVVTESPELPVDILIDVFALLEIPDLIRAGSVCSMWHTAYTSLRSHGSSYQRPQTPCLLYTSELDADNVACLYSPSENRVYKLTLPEPPIRSRYLIGCSNGWLVTADESSELHIVNPMTGKQIALPPVATIEQVKPIFDEAGAVQEYELAMYYGEDEVDSGTPVCSPDNLRDYLCVKAYVFSVDPLAGSYIVVLIHNPVLQLSFAREGDSHWTWLPPSAAYEDCMYMDGLLYAVTSTGRIEAFDLTAPILRRQVIMDNTKDYIYEHLYLAQTPSGDVLQVWREQEVVPWEADEGEDAPERDPSEIIIETRKVMIHKVDMVTKELVPVNSFNGHVLFLGHSQSQCISAKEYPHLKENHVYLTDDEDCIASWKSNRRDIGLFNLEDDITEEIVPPQLWCSWPAPIWITPNLTNFGIGM